MIGRMWRLVRFEWLKLRARWLPWLAALAVVVVAGVAPRAGRVVDSAASLSRGGGGGGGDAFANGWTALTGAVGTARMFLVLAVLVLAGSAVAEEGSHRTLKTLLVRPVRRVEVLLAKVLAVWGYGVAVLLVAFGAAALGAELTAGLYDVVDPDWPERVKYDFRTMSGYVWQAVGLSVGPLLAMTCLGVAGSVVSEHPGYATGLSIGALFLLSALGGVSEEAGRWVFVGYAGASWDGVHAIANQYTGARGAFEDLVPWALGVPLVWAAGLFGVSAAVFVSRDVTG